LDRKPRNKANDDKTRQSNRTAAATGHACVQLSVALLALPGSTGRWPVLFGSLQKSSGEESGHRLHFERFQVSGRLPDTAG